MLAPHVAQYPAAVRLADLDQPGEGVERRGDIPSLLGHDDETIVLLIIGECYAEAIKDTPARRRQQLQIDAVFVGKNDVPVRLQDLELVHARGETGDEGRLADGEDRCPPGQ